MAEPSDPKIVDRLKGLPPYEKEKVPVETPPVEEPKEEVAETTAPIETKVEETTAPKEEVKEEPVDEQKKRTAEQFEKLKESNNNLKTALEVEKKKNILDSLIPEPPPVYQPPVPPNFPQPQTTNQVPNPQQYPGLSQNQIKETFQGLVDDQGYVDTGLLISTLTDLREKNRIAEERARKAEELNRNTTKRFDDFERNEIMRKVHDQYPTLNPENVDNPDPTKKFNERFWKYVRNEVVDQWMNGKETDVMGAAREGFDTLYGNDMKKAEKEKLEAAELAKKNINALGTSQSSQRDSYSDHEALVRATQFGKKGAIAERLRKAGM